MPERIVVVPTEIRPVGSEGAHTVPEYSRRQGKLTLRAAPPSIAPGRRLLGTDCAIGAEAQPKNPLNILPVAISILLRSLYLFYMDVITGENGSSL